MRSVSISAYSAATRARRYQERKRSVQRDECRFVLTIDLFLSLSLFVALTSPAQAPVKREIVNSESVGKDKAVVCVSPRERSDKVQSRSRTLAYRPPPLIHTPLYSLANPPGSINMHEHLLRHFSITALNRCDQIWASLSFCFIVSCRVSAESI